MVAISEYNWSSDLLLELFRLVGLSVEAKDVGFPFTCTFTECVTYITK